MNISIDTIVEMRKLHEDGWSLRAIGKEFSMHQQTVKWYMSRYLNYKPVSEKVDITDDVINLYKKGLSLQQIAEELKISKATVFRKIKKYRGG